MSRNYDLCKCGSGKKYKWCCRDKDRQEGMSEAGVDSDREQLAEHLGAGRIEEARASLARICATKPPGTVDAISLLVDQLIFHSCADEAIHLLKERLPQVVTENSQQECALEDLLDQLHMMMILRHFEQNGAGDKERLVQEIEDNGGDLEETVIPAIFSCLTDWRERPASVEQFHLGDLDPEGQDVPEQLAERLFTFGFEFVGYAHDVRGESYVRAHFAMGEILTYLLDRACGVFDEEPQKVNPRQKSNFFCPDKDSLALYINAKVFSLSRPSYHAARMIMDCIPLWFEFLVDKKIVHTKKVEPLLASLREIDIKAE